MSDSKLAVELLPGEALEALPYASDAVESEAADDWGLPCCGTIWISSPDRRRSGWDSMAQLAQELIGGNDTGETNSRDDPTKLPT